MPTIETKDGEIFPGVWLGIIKQLDDEPSHRRTGKCKVEIPDVYGDNIQSQELPWAYPIFPGAINPSAGSGFFLMPKVGSRVCVMFERGEPNSPRWFGGWTQKGRVPFPFMFSQGDKFPHISAWRGDDGMMIRMVEGERLEIFLGESGDFDSDGKFVRDGEHKQYETSFILDKKRKKVSFRSKYDIDVRCKGKINIRAPQIRVRVMPNQLYDEDTEDWYNDPDSPFPTKWELNVFDPDAEIGARITAEPGKLMGRARQVKGFEGK